MKIGYQKGDINDKATLVNLKTEIFDHIILLSYTDIDIQESDAKTLICLLHLRNLSEKANKDTKSKKVIAKKEILLAFLRNSNV